MEQGAIPESGRAVRIRSVAREKAISSEWTLGGRRAKMQDRKCARSLRFFFLPLKLLTPGGKMFHSPR